MRQGGRPVSYVEADKVVLRLTRREVREVLLALASRTINLAHELDAAEPDEAAHHLRSALVADKVHARLKRSAQTKWSGEAL